VLAERPDIAARPHARRLAVVALVAASLTGAAAYAWDRVPPKRVLLLYQTDGSIPANFEFEQSLLEHLHSAIALNLEFYHEQLDLGRFPEYTQRKVAEFRSRYTERKIDVVIFFGNSPIEILAGVPVVQVDNAVTGHVTGNAYSGNSVHVSFDTDARKTVDAARRLQPRARKVLLISGTSVTDRVDVEWFRRRLRDEPNLDIEVINNLSVPGLISLVSRLPRDVIVLPVSYFRDPEGNSYIPRDVLTQLAYASTAPVYAVSDTLIGSGLVGGHVVNWSRTGELAADAAAQILGGKSPSEVVLKSPGSGVYMFDWRQLKRWGFSERDLPPGSVVKYRVPTAWEQYRWRIIGIGVLVIAQSLLIISLLIQRYRRRHAEESLRDMTGRLLQSQDDERRRIARDLHDGTGQHLSGIALGLGQVLADFPPGYARLRQLLRILTWRAGRLSMKFARFPMHSIHQYWMAYVWCRRCNGIWMDCKNVPASASISRQRQISWKPPLTRRGHYSALFKKALRMDSVTLVVPR
jgi:ABC-type uncharacterized transport system substrate-binding protein